MDRTFVDSLPNDEKDVAVNELFLALTERLRT